jgi:hypothetical protein
LIPVLCLVLVGFTGCRPSAPSRSLPKKGAAMVDFDGATTALTDSGVSWYYDWAAAPNGIAAPTGVAYTPMIWGAAAATTATLSAVRREGGTLLGFNEPDLAGQANLTVSQALALWPKLMATGLRLGSPAPADGAATAGSWFDRFMKGAQAKGYRVDFIAVHWYGYGLTTATAVARLKAYLAATYARWHKPIWLTEYALARFSPTPAYATAAQEAAFVKASAAMLDGLAYVERYAWFIFSPEYLGNPGSSLYRAGGSPTTIGRAYRAAPS